MYKIIIASLRALRDDVARTLRSSEQRVPSPTISEHLNASSSQRIPSRGIATTTRVIASNTYMNSLPRRLSSLDESASSPVLFLRQAQRPDLISKLEELISSSSNSPPHPPPISYSFAPPLSSHVDDILVILRDIASAPHLHPHLTVQHFQDVFDIIVKDQPYPLETYTEAASSLMMKCGLDPGAIPYNVAVETAGAAFFDSFERVSALIDEMVAARVKPNQTTWRSLLKSLAASESGSGCQAVIELASKHMSVEEMDVVFDAEEHSMVLKAFCQGQRVRDAEKYFIDNLEGKGKAFLEHYQILLEEYANRVDATSFTRIFTKFLNRGFTPNSSVLSAVIQLEVGYGKEEEAILFYKSIEEVYGVKPDEVIFQNLIFALGRAGFPEKALDVMQDMEAAGFKPTANIYVAIICTLASNKFTLHAMKYVYLLQSSNLKLRPPHYHRLMRAFFDMNDATTAFEVFKDMTLSNFPPTHKTFAILIYGCFQCQMPDRALEYLDAMKVLGIKRTSKTYRALTRGCGLVKDKLELGRDFLMEHIDTRVTPPPQPWSYVWIVAQYCRDGNVKVAETILSKLDRYLKEIGAPPPPYLAYEAVIEAHLSKPEGVGNVVAADMWMRKARGAGYHLRRYAYGKRLYIARKSKDMVALRSTFFAAIKPYISSKRDRKRQPQPRRKVIEDSPLPSSSPSPTFLPPSLDTLGFNQVLFGAAGKYPALFDRAVQKMSKLGVPYDYRTVKFLLYHYSQMKDMGAVWRVWEHYLWLLKNDGDVAVVEAEGKVIGTEVVESPSKKKDEGVGRKVTGKFEAVGVQDKALNGSVVKDILHACALHVRLDLAQRVWATITADPAFQLRAYHVKYYSTLVLKCWMTLQSRHDKEIHAMEKQLSKSDSTTKVPATPSSPSPSTSPPTDIPPSSSPSVPTPPNSLTKPRRRRVIPAEILRLRELHGRLLLQQRKLNIAEATVYRKHKAKLAELQRRLDALRRRAKPLATLEARLQSLKGNQDALKKQADDALTASKGSPGMVKECMARLAANNRRLETLRKLIGQAEEATRLINIYEAKIKQLPPSPRLLGYSGKRSMRSIIVYNQKRPSMKSRDKGERAGGAGSGGMES